MFVHLVYFEGRVEPDRFVLPDRKLFEEFTAWLSDPKSAKGGWYYEHDEGSLTAISFQQVASMLVRPQPTSNIEPPPPASGEHAIRRA
jgi:hypothetical protein